MPHDYESCLAAAGYLAERTGMRPEIALVLGSGLGSLADEVEGATVIPYGEIPGFLLSTAPDHAGKLVAGRIAGRPVAVMSGRFHCYEGYSMAESSAYVRVLRLWGVKSLILTNAAGSINPDNRPGDLMLLTDHIKLQKESPLAGPNDTRFGPRFFDMTRCYDPDYQALARRCAAALGIPLKEGVYIYFAGPQFETPAEIRAARLLGADAVGMSTVPEVITAAHCGLRTVAISCLTNMAAGVVPGPVTGEEVNRTAASASARFRQLLRRMVEMMDV